MNPTLLEYLYDLRSKGSCLGLHRIQKLLKILGNPHHSLNIIHVAGTNGKGSTCAMIANALQLAGYKTALYTSPHLVHLNERLQINQIPIPPQQLEKYISFYIENIEIYFNGDEEGKPTFFEVITAIAFLYFKDEAVDVAVIEVGLGGRLDATNIVTPLLSVITSIGYDHMPELGYTLEAIAAEKAGIIKPNKPVFLGDLPIEAQTVIQSIAKHNQSDCFSFQDMIHAINAYVENLDNLRVNLFGDYQKQNAILAFSVCNYLYRNNFYSKLTPLLVINSFQSVNWVGRWTRIPSKYGQLAYLDGAHNKSAIQAIKTNIIHLQKSMSFNKIIFCLASIEEYRAKEIIKYLISFVDEIIIVESSNKSFLSVDTYLQHCPEVCRGKVRGMCIEEVLSNEGVLCGSLGDLVVITGSLYLVGEVWGILLNEKRDLNLI